ncbi:MAG TPA: pilus assembly protein N-terminal domain-containing protein [Bryobacteraceae bacterium]|nr:pilus assembly protein N-terminal domain-containing protein [Bryobacteraceae bacterium]
MRWRDVILFLCAALAAAEVPAGGEGAAREYRLTVGESTVIDSSFDIARIATTAPQVVDTVALSRREVLLLAKGYGSSTVGIWSKAGERVFYKVTVAHDLGQVRDLLRRTFPDETIDVQSAQDALSLTGRVTSQTVAERAAALVAPLAKSVVNNVQIAPPGPDKQVMLRVKFAELNRSATASFGFNLMSTGALNTTGRTTTGQFSPPSPSRVYPLGLMMDGLTGLTPSSPSGQVSNWTLSDALNIFAFRPDLNLGAFIQALRSQGVLQILAEPNLVATDAKEASFLVGGEFPVPVVQGGASVGAVTVIFREFGIRLTFQPRITPNRTIKLHVKPEVSTIDIANSVVISGFTIPALSTRRMETDIELAEGQSFVIAGLMDDRATETLSKVPGLSSVPVLGALFKSRQENKTKTELVVIVTPSIADPAEAAGQASGPVMPMGFLPPLPAPGGQQPERK